MSWLWCHCLSFIFTLAFFATVARAAEQSQGVHERRFAEWVGDDLGLCLEMDGLPRHWASFSAGPLAARLAAFPPLAAWREHNRGMLAAVRAEVERRTGLPLKLLLTRLLGGEVLFAIWPPADPSSGKPNVLLLAEAADGDLMRSTLKTLVSARKKAGKWRGETSLNVAGETFLIDAVAPDDEQAEFFVTSADRVAMIATSEAMLRDVLERRAGQARASSLAHSPAYLAACERLAPGAAGRAFINPRAWDAALVADLQRKPPGSADAQSQKAVVTAWAATDYVAAAVHLDRNLQAEIAWQWRAGDLPPALREVAVSLAGELSLVGELPGDCLVAVAAHADVGRLIRLMIAKGWKETQGDSKQRGESMLAWALAPGIGPDISAYLRAPAVDGGAAKERLPLDAVFAVQTRPLEPGTSRPPLVQQLEPLVHAWLSAAVAAANRQESGQPASLQTQKLDGGEETTVVSGIVPGYPRQEFAYRVDKDDRLWVGTSAGLLTANEPPQGLLADSAIDVNRPHGRNFSGLAYINLAGWRQLTDRGREAVDFLWQDKRLDDRASAQKYRELQVLTQLADRLLLTIQVDTSTVHLSLRISAGD